MTEPSVLKTHVHIGFDGDVRFGLNLHPDEQHTLIPLGCKVVINNLKTKTQDFLVGHSNKVSCLHISQSGKFVASGQINHMGFRAPVIFWDFYERKELARYDLHKVAVETICFTGADKYVVSIGGEDDGYVIVFDIALRTPICRAIAANSTSGNATYVCPLNKHSSWFLVSGDHHIRLWKIHREQKKLSVSDIQIGRHKRKYTSMFTDPDDKNAFIGTMTGDVAHLRLSVDEQGNMSAILAGLYGKHNPKKPIGKDCEKYVNGIREILFVTDTRILLGAGDGTVELIELRNESFRNYPNPTWPKFKALKSSKVCGAVTSIARKSSNIYYIGTDYSEIYELNITNFHMALILTCYKKLVKEITFPANNSNIFAVAGYESIRIWSMKRLLELLRIMVYNFSCTGVAFSNDGSSLVSAWNDGVIRAFTPVTGRLMYAIPSAHNKGCNALALSSNGKILVSAGFEGQVRVWKIERLRQSLIALLKDHTGPISSLHFNKTDTEVISAGTDGSCVIWDIIRLARKNVICANTQFMHARYHPSNTQFLTVGSDGMIGYWMTVNGSLLRELEGADKQAVNCVTFSPLGDYFVTVGADCLVKLWDYQKGTVIASGDQHASPVTCCRFSPCGKYCVTGSSSGCIIIWNMPQQCWIKTEKPYIGPPEPRYISSAKGKENISSLEISRKNKHMLCAECPLVDVNNKPDINEQCNG